MGIFGALTTAVTGMRAQSFALENISGNIANSQTTAFKRIDSTFIDLIPDNDPSKQFAGNVVANSRATNSVQGDIQNSSVGTFMAINGEGFFVVQKPSNFADNRPVFDGIDRYTRRGDFQTDKNGYLVNGAGYYLLGIPVDATTGNLTGSVPQLLQFANDFLPAQPTTQIQYRANLASYPLTAGHDNDIPTSELLNPADFSANPIAGPPAPATTVVSEVCCAWLMRACADCTSLVIEVMPLLAAWIALMPLAIESSRLPRSVARLLRPCAVKKLIGLSRAEGQDEQAARRRRAVSRGRVALDALDELKVELLAGTLGPSVLMRLKSVTADLLDASGDEKLDAVLAEIDLRVAVEIAKMPPR